MLSTLPEDIGQDVRAYNINPDHHHQQEIYVSADQIVDSNKPPRILTVARFLQSFATKSIPYVITSIVHLSQIKNCFCEQTHVYFKEFV